MPIALTGGGFKDPAGNLVSGKLVLVLSQDAKLAASNNLICPKVQTVITVTAGALVAGTSIYGTDELLPSGLFYTAKVTDSNNNIVYGPELWQPTGGGTLDVGTITPLAAAPNTANVILSRFENIRFADQFTASGATTALQAAINDLPSTGGTVFLAAGTYSQNTALSIPFSGISIIGAGRNATVINTTMTSGFLFPLTNVSECRVADLTINNTGTGGANAFIFNYSQRSVIERFTISGPFTNGIIMNPREGIGSTIFNVVRDGLITGPTVRCIWLDSSTGTNQVINANIFSNLSVTAASGGTALSIIGGNTICNENTVLNCQFTASGGTGISIAASSARDLILIGCTLEGSTTGISIGASNTVRLLGNEIASNTANVSDSASGNSEFIGNNVGGTVQILAITPAGNLQCNGLGTGSATPVANGLNMPTGSGVIQASGTTLLTLNTTGTTANQPILIAGANGETWKHGNNTENLTLSTSGATTDTSANLLPADSIIEAVVARVTTTITTATDWKLGDPTTAGRFSAPNATMTSGTTQVGTVHADQTGAPGPRQVSAAKVRVTTTGTPGAGAIRITVFFRQFVPPTA